MAGAGMRHMTDQQTWATDTISLADGRGVAVHLLKGGESTVVFCHASAGAGRFDPDPAVTTARGVSLLAVDRPGYGASEPVSGEAWASVDSAAGDVAAVLDRRGGRAVGIAGWSGGGRVAMALAARRPDLVTRVVVIATPAPDEEVPWVPSEFRQGIEAMRGRPAAPVHAGFREQMAGIIPDDPASDGALGLLGVDPAADAEALDRDGLRDRLARMLADAFAQGPAGMVADIAGYSLRPWGFEPSEVRAKTLLLYGARDQIGHAHGAWWQRRLPDARLEMVPDAGHLVVVPTWNRALRHLAPRVAAR
jgi:pimeloyl-ACP methyl ester carboxylesterase